MEGKRRQRKMAAENHGSLGLQWENQISPLCALAEIELLGVERPPKGGLGVGRGG